MSKSNTGVFRGAKDEKHLYASPVIAWFLPIVTGLFAGILVATPVSLVTWRYFEDTRPFYTFTITAVSVTLIVWLMVLRWIFQKLDLIPEKASSPVEITLKSNEGRTIQLYKFESVAPWEFTNIAEMVVRGGDLTYDSLIPFLGRSRAKEFKTELVRERLAEWVDPNEHRSGMSLTRKGWVIFRNYNRGLSLSPTLEVDNGQ